MLACRRQSAYRTPDFGIWERGNKSNHGEPELNASSIGMVTAALEAIDGLNVFGARGGPHSVVYVTPDAISRNYTVLSALLPRESRSKEVDAATLSIISFPAFAVGDPSLLESTHARPACRLVRRPARGRSHAHTARRAGPGRSWVGPGNTS